MGKVESRVIKPPIEKVVSGKIFKPDKAYTTKVLVKNAGIAFMIWFLTMASTVGLLYVLYFIDPAEFGSAIDSMNIWAPKMSYWMIIGNLLWLIPAEVLTPIYINSIEYSVISESGESMPEIYVKKGILTITRKHVPFRTITNISSNAGVFDRIFGLGSVSIETAGYSGSNQTGPEEKLEGIRFYEEVRDFILNELRKFRTPYVTTTEPDREAPVPRGPGLDDEILITLREIRDLLKEKGE
ncbi:MAG: PH domain-containing protein [Candidatus Bathyarchaeota archaeon]|nr:PH domain-containing protein [Candidatus Bathyarchaeota archaeon]